MNITVQHEVPYDKNLENKCLYSGDFFGNEVCKYHVLRDRTHGRKAPIERKKPKCTLFDVWLPGEKQKCEQCMKAIEAQKEEPK